MWVVIGRGERHAWRSCGTDSPAKRDHIRGWGRTSWHSKQHQRRWRCVIRPESLEPFCRPYADFSPAGKVSRDERGSNHDGHGHKKDVQIAV